MRKALEITADFRYTGSRLGKIWRTDMDIIAKISEELGIKRHQTEAAVKLIDEGNTIPFIARYRQMAALLCAAPVCAVCGAA